MIAKCILISFILNAVLCVEDRRVITTLKYAKRYIRPHTVHSNRAAIGQCPYVVSIKEPMLKLRSHQVVYSAFCGGSIIGETRVLTAAHCFENKDFYFAKHPEILRVVAGSYLTDIAHSGRTENTLFSQWRKVKNIRLHDEYNYPNNDIAVVFVNVYFMYSPRINYIQIATRRTDYAGKCFSSGYSRTRRGNEDPSPVFLRAQIYLMPKDDCSKLWEINMDKFICTNSVIEGVVQGEAGGPLTCNGTLDPAEKRGKDLLVGVVSGKNFDKTSLFTRVSAYHNWIEGNNGSSLRSNVLCLMIIFLSV